MSTEITITECSKAWAEGHADHKGVRYEWMAYRESDKRIRAMVSTNGIWIPRETGHPLGALILPIASGAMNGTLYKPEVDRADNA